MRITISEVEPFLKVASCWALDQQPWIRLFTSSAHWPLICQLRFLLRGANLTAGHLEILCSLFWSLLNVPQLNLHSVLVLKKVVQNRSGILLGDPLSRRRRVSESLIPLVNIKSGNAIQGSIASDTGHLSLLACLFRMSWLWAGVGTDGAVATSSWILNGPLIFLRRLYIWLLVWLSDILW